MSKVVCCLALLCILTLPLLPWQSGLSARRLQAQHNDSSLDVQAFLDQHPGTLKTYREDGQSAATIIGSNSLYYSLHPHLYLVLLETTGHLLSDANPPPATVSQPFGPAGPAGFAAQIEWASQELRAGLGPYDEPPTLTFRDGQTRTLSLDMPPEKIAVQQFLAQGRSLDEWQALVDRFGQVLRAYAGADLARLFQSAAPAPTATTDTAPGSGGTGGFLHLPWPAGTNVVHLAYFDHVYPTVDSGADGNDMVMTYLGNMDVQYNTHDGHDFSFPDQLVGTPILAAAPGMAYARTMRGNGVVILHENGYETVYWHLNDFAPRFYGVIDSAQGVWVEAGEMLGTSGSSGFVYGTPHLHFEVRHNGRQVDPYGWQGAGPDPCAAYAGCEASPWLWHDSLTGTYDFMPPEPGDTSGVRPPRENAPDFLRQGASVSQGTSSNQRTATTAQSTAQPTATATSDGASAPPLSLDDDAARGLATPPDPFATSTPSASATPTASPTTPTRTPTASATPTPSPTPRRAASTATPTASAAPTTSATAATLAQATATPDPAWRTDRTPPLGTLSINPPDDLLLYVPFDGHSLQHIGHGQPATQGTPQFASGLDEPWGQSLALPTRTGLTYPISNNVSLAAGSISLWVRLPETYPPTSIDRHYLFAASAHPEDLENGIYTGTLALRRDMLGEGDTPRWNFWTTPLSGEDGRHDLAVPDEAGPGWHHFVVTWEREQGRKQLYIDGELAAAARGVALPEDIGSVLQLGRFTYDGRQSGALFDEVAVYSRVLAADEIAAMAGDAAPPPVSAETVYSPTLLLDTNATDAESGVAELRLGRDGEFVGPLAPYDTFVWDLPHEEGTYTLAVEYRDAAGNQSVVTREVTLNLPPRGAASITAYSPLTATLAISATDMQPPIDMQISPDNAFEQAPWLPLRPRMGWAWNPASADDPRRQNEAPELYIRFRDASGRLSEPLLIPEATWRISLPLVAR